MIRVIRTAAAATVLLTCHSAINARPRTNDAPNMLTQGVVSMTLRVGQTSQYEVLQAFGGPNVSTLDGAGNEVWVYDRHATVSYDKNSGFSIGILAGGGGGGAGVGGGFGFGSSKSRNEQSSRTMTLIIKFGPDKRVIDFQSRSSSF
jgi:hypothetical protein